MPQMSDDQLKAITDQEIKASLGYSSGELAKNRLKALQYYYHKAEGDLAAPAIPGRSSVVSTDVLDTVEWMLPALMQMFVKGDKVVEFKAKTEKFEPWEKHAEEYIGKHVFYVQNDGFLVLQTWFKDALLAKNGVIKVWWDKADEEAREDYQGLSDVELAMLLQDEHLEPIEHTERLDDATGMKVHDIAVKRVVTKGFCRIENVPPEEFLISRRAKGTKESQFTAHRFERTIGELKEAGYKNIDNLSSDDSEALFSQERVTRKVQNDEMSYLGSNQNQTSDPSSRVVWVTECYMKVDADGDGIPEWRKITRAGNQILENVECDGSPFISICPIPIPHQFFGLSEADLAMEAQRTKTSLLRAMLDNLYLQVNGRTWALEDEVNLDDLLTNRPGGVVRVKRPDAVGMLQTGNGDLGSAMQFMDYMDQVKETRTGFTRNSQGANPDALNQTATGMNIITNRADLRLELVGRNFAQGVKELFIKVLELVSKYQDKAERIKATGGWIDIDPREWHNQFHLTVNVGLGTGNKEEQIQALQMLGSAMQQAAAAGIVKPNNVYNAGCKLVEALDFGDSDKYFTDPAKMPPQQPKPDPALLQVEAAIKIEDQKFKLAQYKEMMKLQMDFLKLQADMGMKREELAAKVGIMTEELNHKVIQASTNGRTAAIPDGVTGGASQNPIGTPALQRSIPNY